MSGQRVLVHVQHLLGIGHLQRAALLAAGMSESGLDVALVSGGRPTADPPHGGARLIQLPPISSRDETFKTLVDGDGREIDDAYRNARRDKLLAVFDAERPDAVVIELFPFGRRQMRFELLPLLDACHRLVPRPLVVSSIRDVLQAGRAPARIAETTALARDRFDRVLVHGDPGLIDLAESFPNTRAIADKIHYTGYVAPPMPAAGGPGDVGWREVLVSVGGGAVGRRLMECAIAARPHTALADRTWRLLAGHNLPAPAFAALARDAPAGTIVERARKDFRFAVMNSTVSVSQAGYNTVADLLSARARAVLVPFAAGGETEQTMRAHRLAARGLAQTVEEAELAPGALAAAVDRAAAAPRPDAGGVDLSGTETSARLLAGWLGHGRRGTQEEGENPS